MFEIFKETAGSWWDESGTYKVLHDLTPLRMEYIARFLDFSTSQKIMDFGCGGGLVSLPLLRKGAEVFGIDEVEESLAQAQERAQRERLSFQSSKTLEYFQGIKFDNIVCLEVLEHLDNPQQLLSELANFLKPKGRIILSTLNRTFLSHFLGIFVAERILKWAPDGVHNWNYFLKPHEIGSMLKNSGFKVLDIQGYTFLPLKQKWDFCKSKQVNYFITGELM